MSVIRAVDRLWSPWRAVEVAGFAAFWIVILSISKVFPDGLKIVFIPLFAVQFLLAACVVRASVPGTTSRP